MSPLTAQSSAADATSTEEPNGPWRLPEGPWADALAALPTDVEPSLPSAPAWPAWNTALDTASAWDGEAPWRRWVELLRAERDASKDESGADRAALERRTSLAFLALEQGRHADAWRHLEPVAADPALFAGALAGYLPGVPADHPRLAGGAPAPLAPGTLLRPALPPTMGSARGQWRPGETVLERLRVGDSVLRMRVLLERDGIDVTFTHLEGPPAHLVIRLPVPEGVSVGAVYADWESQEDPGAPVEVELPAREDPFTIWGRFLPRSEPWSHSLPLRLPARAHHEGLALVLPAEPDAATARLERFSEALGELFELPTRCLAPDAEPGGHPLRLTFHRADDPPGKLEALLSQVEGFVLGLR